MPKILLLGIVVLGILFIFFFINNKSLPTESESVGSKTGIKNNKSGITNNETNNRVEAVEKSVFVPYWNVTKLNNLQDYESAIYFGVSVTENGVNREDQGFTTILNFINTTSNNKRYITLRMLDTDTNLKILDNQQAEDTIIADMISIAQEYGFDGVVLDLELSVIPFNNVTQNVNLFVKNMSAELQKNSLAFGMTMYGDAYYRSRPFDMKTIGEHVDELMIMAYDFHKSRGEPGPNFPLEGRKTYGYDFQQMVTDFAQDVPSDKITVVFGMYGYNWTLGAEGKPLTGAKSLSLADMKAEFVQSCSYKSCVVTRDQESAETHVTYRDEEHYEHSVWFEDEESVEKKLEYLKDNGIGSISYWTWGYW